MLQTIKGLTQVVAAPTPFPLGTLHLVLPVDFMQEASLSLPMTLKCFTRQHLKACRIPSLPIQAALHGRRFTRL